MQIVYHGHACFEVKDDNFSIVFDPFDPSIGLGKLNIKANEVYISHDHFDHNYKDGVQLLKNDDFNLECKKINSFHDDSNGLLRGKNLIHVVKFNSFTICHLGDLGHLLDEDTIDDIGKVDILFIPVGGVYTIDGKQAADLVKKIKAKIIIPMHYANPKSSVKLESVEVFLENTKDFGITKVDNNILELDKSMNDGIYVLNANE